ELVHNGFDGYLAIVRCRLDEGLNIFWSGRQTDQVEIDAADQCSRVGVADRLQTLGIQPGHQKLVNVRARPRRVRDAWRLRFLRRLEGPELPALLNVDLFRGDNFLTVPRVGG